MTWMPGLGRRKVSLLQRGLRLALAVWFVAFAGSTVRAEATPPVPAPFVMAFDEDPTTFGIRWSLKIHTEAFRRLDIPLQPRFLPFARRAAMADEGAVDGDNARVFAYGSAHPNLIRVEEPVMTLGFGLYGTNPRLHLERVQDLATADLLVEYRSGIVFCETSLKPWVSAERLTVVKSEDQGLRKLVTGRTDVYCDLDNVIWPLLVTPEFKESGRIRKLMSIGELPTYPYLHRKHAELVPRLAATLKQMKAEGLIEAYRLQVERELGWLQ